MGTHIALPLSVHQGERWLSGSVLDWRSRGCGFEHHQRHWERSGSVVVCLTGDQGVAGSSITRGTGSAVAQW